MLDADGDVRCLNAEKDRWHSLECLESAVLFECKNFARISFDHREDRRRNRVIKNMKYDTE